MRAESPRLLLTDSVPDEIARVLRPLLEKWSWLVPSICHEIEVFYDPGDDEPGKMMAVELTSEYRRAAFYVYGPWLGERKAERERCVVHELCHIVTGPLAEVADDLADRAYKADEKLRDYAREQIRRACEGVVVDLTQALLGQRSRRKR